MAARSNQTVPLVTPVLNCRVIVPIKAEGVVGVGGVKVSPDLVLKRNQPVVLLAFVSKMAGLTTPWVEYKKALVSYLKETWKAFP